MRGTELLDKMGLISPGYIAEAEKKSEKLLRRRKLRRVRLGVGSAACICAAVFGAYAAARFGTANPDTQNTNLEKINIPQLVTGMGFEGYLCRDISELENGNPWSEEMNITSLPVYKNLAFDETRVGFKLGLDEVEMTEMLFCTMESLGLSAETSSIEVSRDACTLVDGKMTPLDNATAVRAVTDKKGEKLTVYADGMTEYFLPDNTFLPSGYSFTRTEEDDAEAEKALGYLVDEYADFLGISEPALSAHTLGRGVDGVVNRKYTVYDAAGDDEDLILNYNFAKTTFSPNSSGCLRIIRKENALSAAEKLGDYPLVTADEAKKRLADGCYQTSVPLEFPGEDKIAKYELVYRVSAFEEVLLPYYRFYVLLPDSLNRIGSEIGLKLYGAYYVPAIEEEYIENMPLWDGSFD